MPTIHPVDCLSAIRNIRVKTSRRVLRNLDSDWVYRMYVSSWIRGIIKTPQVSKDEPYGLAIKMYYCDAPDFLYTANYKSTKEGSVFHSAFILYNRNQDKYRLVQMLMSLLQQAKLSPIKYFEHKEQNGIRYTLFAQNEIWIGSRDNLKPNKYQIDVIQGYQMYHKVELFTNSISKTYAKYFDTFTKSNTSLSLFMNYNIYKVQYEGFSIELELQRVKGLRGISTYKSVVEDTDALKKTIPKKAYQLLKNIVSNKIAPLLEKYMFLYRIHIDLYNAVQFYGMTVLELRIVTGKIDLNKTNMELSKIANELKEAVGFSSLGIKIDKRKNDLWCIGLFLGIAFFDNPH